MSKHILIIDDEPDIAVYLSAILRANGYTPVTADNAQSGLAAAQENRPDLICLDIMMPRESGISLYKRLKNETNLKNVPVMIISGVETEGKFDFRSYVPDDSIPPPEFFMEKPIDVDTYIKAIKKLTT